jgi:hypothetical protein
MSEFVLRVGPDPGDVLHAEDLLRQHHWHMPSEDVGVLDELRCCACPAFALSASDPLVSHDSLCLTPERGCWWGKRAEPACMHQWWPSTSSRAQWCTQCGANSLDDEEQR